MSEMELLLAVMTILSFAAWAMLCWVIGLFQELAEAERKVDQCVSEQECGWQPWCRIEGRCKRECQSGYSSEGK